MMTGMGIAALLVRGADHALRVAALPDVAPEDDAVRPEKEGVLDGVQQTPLRVGQPVLAVNARTTVEPDDSGNASDKPLPIVLPRTEGGHHRVGATFDRCVDHGPRILQSFDRPEVRA
jgi:hypothetical protein